MDENRVKCAIINPYSTENRDVHFICQMPKLQISEIKFPTNLVDFTSVNKGLDRLANEIIILIGVEVLIVLVLLWFKKG